MATDHETAKADNAAKLDRANAMLDRCRSRDRVSLSQLQWMRNELAELVERHGAALDELERLRVVRTCGSVAKLFGDEEHVCVLPFGHGPEHRNENGTRWQIYDAPPQSDDALKAMVRQAGLTLPVSQQPWFNADSAPQQPEHGGEA